MTCNGHVRAYSPFVINSNNIADDCIECARLLSRYEAATFEQAKLQNMLGIAQHIADPSSTHRLKLEAYQVMARQGMARSTFVHHQDTFHKSPTQ